MNRRNFLQQVLVWSSGIIITEPIFRITAEMMAAEAVPPILSIGNGKDYSSLVAAVLRPLGGMAAFVKPGDIVVVKPNMGWDRRPEQGANTHPEIVRAVVEHAIKAGAKKVLIFDRTCNEKRRCYVNSGIKSALDSIGSNKVQCRYIDKRKFIPVNIEKGKSITKWSFYKDALQADCYINLPVAKHHSLAKLTLGLKNTMGVIGGNRGKIHSNMGQNLADLNTVIRSNLTIIDATRILLRNGPQGGSIKDVKVLDTVLASPDPVAADAYATTLFGLNPEQIDSTRAAAEMGLGEMNLDKIDIRTV